MVLQGQPVREFAGKEAKPVDYHPTPEELEGFVRDRIPASPQTGGAL